MGFITRLKQLRKEQGWTQNRLAQELGVSRNTVAGYESPSKSREPSLDILLRMSSVFNVSLDYLLDRPEAVEVDLLDILNDREKRLIGAGKPITPQQQSLIKEIITAPKPPRRVPLLGAIRPGLPLLHEDNLAGHLEIPFGIEANFAIQINDEDLLWVGLHKGDLALCTETTTVEHGQIVITTAEEDRKSVFARYYLLHQGRPILRAANPAYPDRPVQPGDQVVGVVVCFMKHPPPLHLYQKLLSSRDARLVGWKEVIQEADRYGIKETQVKSLIGLFSQLVKQIPPE